MLAKFMAAFSLAIILHDLHVVVKQEQLYLTNRPDFFMVCTLVDHRNDAIKCSKLEWNHVPQASGFTAKF